jgi:P-type conjugative transfer protein TrbL
MDPNLLQNALTPIASAVGQWQTAIFALGYPIFWMLAFIELGVVFALMIINRDLPGMIDDLVRSVIGIGVGYILLQNAADWMRNGVIATIAEWGGMLSGMSVTSLSPDGILGAGWGLASTLLSAMAHGHWLTMPVSDLVILLAALGVTVVFGWAAIMLLELLIESYVAAIGGSIFLPIGAFRFSSHVTGYYFGWVLSVAVRFFFTLSLLGVALTLVKAWSLELAGDMTLITANLTIPIQIFLESILFLMMLVHVPTFAGRMLVGAVMPSVGVAGLSRSMDAAGDAAGSAAAGAGQMAATAAYNATIGKVIDELLHET